MKLLKNKNLFIFSVLLISLLIFYSGTAFAAKKSGPATIQFQAKDGFNMVGLLDVPASASVKTKAPLVIFLHPLGEDKDAWLSFPAKVKALGVATLCLDLRGHGLSTLNKNEKKRYWQNFSNKEFQKYPDDILYAIKYVKDSYPEINTGKVAIVASDLSANASIIAGSQGKSNIKTLVLISPTMKYKGIEPATPLVNYGQHPILILASQGDRYSYYSSQELIKYAQGVKVLKSFPYGGNGLDLLRFQPQSQQIIIDWLKKYFIGK